jgi:hypothetical protein
MRFGASVENMFVNESNIGFLCLQVLEVTGFERNETGDIVDKDGKVLGKDPNPKFSATITFPDGRTETLSIDTAESVARSCARGALKDHVSHAGASTLLYFYCSF